MRYAPAIWMAIGALLAPLAGSAAGIYAVGLLVAVVLHGYRKCAEWSRCEHCHPSKRERDHA